MNTAETSKKALFGDDTAKVRTFAIFDCENDEKDEKLKYHARHLAIKCTNMTTETHILMIYNIPLYEAERLAEKLELKSFIFGTNTVPAVLNCYEIKNGGKTYSAVRTKEVTYLKEAEEFFSIKIATQCFEDIKALSEAIIDESELDGLFSYKLTPWSCMRCRQRAKGK